jgi:hypothetical protein
VGNPVTATFPSDTVTLAVHPEDGHKVFVSFTEGNPSSNNGNLKGSGVFNIRDGYPKSSTNVPSGPFAPPNNTASVDFGTYLDDTQLGGRAVDFVEFVGNDNTLGPMDRFTLSGWVNAADLQAGWGGNRIVFGLDQGNGRGFDLVHLADGAFQMGGTRPDNVPA